MKITKSIARKVLETVDAGLVRGLGKPIPGKMCVEAAVCYAMGQPHSDEPACVAPALRALKIRLNDACWSSNTVRAKGLRRLALAQLGSAGVLDEVEFVKRLIPLAQKAAAGTARADIAHAAWAAARADVACAARAVAAARAAATAAATAAAHARDAAADKILSDFAEAVVQILIDMKTPGCQWLSLTE